MTATEITELLSWSLGINYGILVIWFGVFLVAHDALYRLHARWFKLSVESFDAIHYAGMTIYKVGVLLLNLVPLLALWLTVK
ncbi:MAG: hypothetical protein A2520_01260 [Deltaproteobacteria bacterium RIFOXYD12_FULL_53_23]|nr:MAG: hypothetical protein A2520_01260 [Deltaproteobacteria bacterium RIFOXYD12_FULL_53_23]